MSRFDEPLHPFFTRAHGLRQRVLELVDPLGLEIDIRTVLPAPAVRTGQSRGRVVDSHVSGHVRVPGWID
jgi:hypothetical protein